MIDLVDDSDTKIKGDRGTKHKIFVMYEQHKFWSICII